MSRISCVVWLPIGRMKGMAPPTGLYSKKIWTKIEFLSVCFSLSLFDSFAYCNCIVATRDRELNFPLIAYSIGNVCQLLCLARTKPQKILKWINLSIKCRGHLLGSDGHEINNNNDSRGTANTQSRLSSRALWRSTQCGVRGTDFNDTAEYSRAKLQNANEMKRLAQQRKQNNVKTKHKKIEIQFLSYSHTNDSLLHTHNYIWQFIVRFSAWHINV